jgi:hypothetical protein
MFTEMPVIGRRGSLLMGRRDECEALDTTPR